MKDWNKKSRKEKLEHALEMIISDNLDLVSYEEAILLKGLVEAELKRNADIEAEINEWCNDDICHTTNTFFDQ